MACNNLARLIPPPPKPCDPGFASGPGAGQGDFRLIRLFRRCFFDAESESGTLGRPVGAPATAVFRPQAHPAPKETGFALTLCYMRHGQAGFATLVMPRASGANPPDLIQSSGTAR